MLNYPVNFNNIEEFEKVNDIPINVFKLSKSKGLLIYYGHKINSNKKIIDLLLINDEDKYHYCYIK